MKKAIKTKKTNISKKQLHQMKIKKEICNNFDNNYISMFCAIITNTMVRILESFKRYFRSILFNKRQSNTICYFMFMCCTNIF